MCLRRSVFTRKLLENESVTITSYVSPYRPISSLFAVHQRKTIPDLLKTKLTKDDTWYLISAAWCKQWKKYVGDDNRDMHSMGKPSANPGPIDNSALFEDGSQDILKENLTDDGQDYILVPEKAWTELLRWYGLTQGQNPIPRPVMRLQGTFRQYLKVEVNIITLKLCRYQEMDDTHSHTFSPANTINDIMQKMRSVFQIADNKRVCVWAQRSSDPESYEGLDSLGRTVCDTGLHHNQAILIEEQNDDGSWPHSGKRSLSELQIIQKGLHLKFA